MGKEEKNDKNYTGHDTSFGTYLWNSETKELLGRTSLAWGKLVFFYTIFYLCLASFSFICYQLFALTLPDNEPKWTLSSSLIGTNPGLGYRPFPDPDKTADSTLIWYRMSNDTDVNHWFDSLNKYINKTQVVQDNNIDCNENKGEASSNQSCKIDLSSYGECTAEKSKYGFEAGEPCILLKLNKIYNWIPDYYGLSGGKYDETVFQQQMEQLNGTMPDDLLNYIKEKANKITDIAKKERFLRTVWISCEGETVADRESLGNIAYYPERGIPGYFLPYLRQPNYHSPFIFVKFTRISRGTLINIECKAHANGLVHDKMTRQGSVHFELLVDGTAKSST